MSHRDEDNASSEIYCLSQVDVRRLCFLNAVMKKEKTLRGGKRRVSLIDGEFSGRGVPVVCRFTL